MCIPKSGNIFDCAGALPTAFPIRPGKGWRKDDGWANGAVAMLAPQAEQKRAVTGCRVAQLEQ